MRWFCIFLDVVAGEPLVDDLFLPGFAADALPGDAARQGSETGGAGVVFGADGQTAAQ